MSKHNLQSKIALGTASPAEIQLAKQFEYAGNNIGLTPQQANVGSNFNFGDMPSFNLTPTAQEVSNYLTTGDSANGLNVASNLDSFAALPQSITNPTGLNVTEGLTTNTLADNNQQAGGLFFGDRMVDGELVKGYGSTLGGLANTALNGFLGFQNLGLAEDQLALQESAFNFNKQMTEQAYADAVRKSTQAGNAITGVA